MHTRRFPRVACWTFYNETFQPFRRFRIASFFPYCLINILLFSAMSSTRQSVAIIPDTKTVSNRATNYEKCCALFSLGSETDNSLINWWSNSAIADHIFLFNNNALINRRKPCIFPVVLSCQYWLERLNLASRRVQYLRVKWVRVNEKYIVSIILI